MMMIIIIIITVYNIEITIIIIIIIKNNSSCISFWKCIQFVVIYIPLFILTLCYKIHFTLFTRL